MSLFGALNIGRSALTAQQAAIQVTGNNIANAGNDDYNRQVGTLTPARDQQIKPGMFVGSGVDLSAIDRQVDDALLQRLRSSASDQSAAGTTADWLSRVESTFNELSDQDLSTQMSTFFNSWSDLANNPQDSGLRQVVLQDGKGLASTYSELAGSLGDLRDNIDAELKAKTAGADQIAGQIADLNGAINAAEGGTSGMANNLRDQRDALLKQLSQYVDIQTVPQANGIINVYVGSEPLVLNTDNRGITLKQETINGQLVTSVAFKANNGTMKITSGELGALGDVRAKVNDTLDQIDDQAHNLIFELNKIHASGQGTDSASTVTGTNVVTDPTAALNDPKSGLTFKPANGSFVVHVTDKSSGLSTSTLVHIDLDGIGGNDTTLNSLAVQLNGIANVSASVSGGRLVIKGGSDSVGLTFSQDTSGTLAALGVNNFFTGTDASTIAVSQTLLDDPSLLAAAKNGDKADNQTALAIAKLATTSMKGLGNVSLNDSYAATVNGIGAAVSTAKTNVTAAKAVSDTLENQRQALSGVSTDEEAINLVREQRAYQAAAKLINTINDLMDTLLSIVK